MKIIGTGADSHCIYCNTLAYGPSCIYSPHKKHVHQDDPKRCIYCGSMTFGPGCPYNPFGKIHVHGVDYNQAVKECVNNNLTAIVFISELNQPIKETEAFRLGLIDEACHRLKAPETSEEKCALSPFKHYLFKLKRMLGEGKLELLNSNVIMEMITTYKTEEKFDSKKYEQEMKLKIATKQIVESYKNLVQTALETGFTKEEIETILLENLLLNEN